MKQSKIYHDKVKEMKNTNANNLSRNIVRGWMYLGNVISFILPKTLQKKLDAQFIQPEYTGKEMSSLCLTWFVHPVNLII